MLHYSTQNQSLKCAFTESGAGTGFLIKNCPTLRKQINWIYFENPTAFSIGVSQMQFYGKITVSRYAEDNWNPEVTDIFFEKFEARSIQSAKSKLTQIANSTELFAWVQSWDNEKRTYTGKDVRWRPWLSPPATYKQDNGIEVAYSTRMSERVFGETLDTGSITAQRFGRSVEYRVDLAVHWKFKGK